MHFALHLLGLSIIVASKGSRDTSYHISPALGAGISNDKLRISVVSRGAPRTGADVWDYSDHFQVRWSEFSLSTKLSDAGTSINVGDGVTIRTHLPNSRTRAVVFGDPCIVQSAWCNGGNWGVWSKLAQTLDVLAGQVDVVVIVGDNFYDHRFGMVPTWWSQLSVAAQAIPVITVPGNHDFWIQGSPEVVQSDDNLGFAFMQMYGMDTLASVGNPKVYDFSQATPNSLSSWRNFFHYSVVGSIGFIAFSGGHSFEEQQAGFKEACEQVASAQPRMVLLVSHWDALNHGAKLTTPDAFSRLTSPGGYCSKVAGMVHVMGHTHRNAPVGNHGFVLGATGMNSDQWGFALFDTLTSENRVKYFKMGDMVKDYSSDVIQCLKTEGIENCPGEMWAP